MPAGCAHRSASCRAGLVLTLLLPVLLAAAERIDHQAEQQPAHIVLATINSLSAIPVDLAPDLTDAGVGALPITVLLAQADHRGQCQALAHALGCWWQPTTEGSTLSARRTMAAVGPLRSTVYTSRLLDAYAYEKLILTAMAPHLDGERGLSYHPASGRWSATLDQIGHDRLLALLSALERPAASIPALLPSPGLPPHNAILPLAGSARSWPRLAQLLHQGTALSVSIAATAEPLHQAITLEAATLNQCLALLMSHGVHAAVIDGVLCLDSTPIQERVHPGLRGHVCLLPVVALGDRTAVAALSSRWQRDINPLWWRQPGALLHHLVEAGLLLTICDRHTCARLLNAIERGEHEVLAP
ncbi:MAG: hypothetical protein ACYTF0_00410 [Planctomycetota bacterium]|jgi:hypothetical protein